MIYDRTTPMGPYVKKLFIHFMAASIMDERRVKTIGDALSAIASLSNEATKRSHTQHALHNLNESLAAVRAAPDNPYVDDEYIAAEILRRIDTRKGTKPCTPP